MMAEYFVTVTGEDEVTLTLKLSKAEFFEFKRTAAEEEAAGNLDGFSDLADRMMPGTVKGLN